MESVIKNIFKVTIVIKEIKCTGRIEYENWNFLKLLQLVTGPVNVFFYTVYQSGKMVLADK